MTIQTNLAAALVAAQRDSDAVSKTSKNTFHGYKYASAEALIAEARESLTKNGLALFSTEWRVVPQTFEGGGPSTSKVVVEYVLTHTSGESLHITTETSVVPEKGRPQDKAESAALTLNLGYTLRGLLLLPREDESLSVDQRDDRPKTKVPTQGPTTVQTQILATPQDAIFAEGIAKLEVARKSTDLDAIRSWAKTNGLGDSAQFKILYSERFAALRGSENGAAK